MKMSVKRAILNHDTKEVWRLLHNLQYFSTREDLFLLPFLEYNEDLTNQLLFFEYNLNLVHDGSTVLHMAAWAGNYELIVKLLHKGARVDILDENGNTALHRGCLSSVKVVRILVEAGVDTNVKNK